jgi:hypothetical protein
MTEDPSEDRANEAFLQEMIRKVAAVIALMALVFLGAEAAIRIEDGVRWGMPLLSQTVGVADLAMSDSTGRHPRPGARFRQWRINSLGVRGPEPDSVAQAPRAIVLGASETFGLYESPGHEYVQQLQDSIRARGCSADVLNAAFVGMSLPTVEQDFRLRLASLQPRVAVYYPTPPQYLDDQMPQAVAPDAHEESTPVWRRWHWRAVERLLAQLKALLPRAIQDRSRQSEIASARASHDTAWLFSRIPTVRIDAFEHDLRTLVGTLRSRGAVPILITHANAFTGSPPAADDRLRAWEKFYPRATGATLIAFDSVAAIRTRQVATDSGAAVVDAWAAFHGVPSDAMFADFSHFTDAGAARMAALLAPAVGQALGCKR